MTFFSKDGSISKHGCLDTPACVSSSGPLSSSSYIRIFPIHWGWTSDVFGLSRSPILSTSIFDSADVQTTNRTIFDASAFLLIIVVDYAYGDLLRGLKIILLFRSASFVVASCRMRHHDRFSFVKSFEPSSCKSFSSSVLLLERVLVGQF